MDGRIYIGITNNLMRRIDEHNNGHTRSTKAYAPWTLVHIEKMRNRIEARKREKYLKSGCGKEFIKSFIPR